jgi:methylated-DNA-protein-cysteine methyltransferase-like protein
LVFLNAVCYAELVVNCFYNSYLLAKKKVAAKKSAEQLKSVLPSGKRDSSFFEQVYDVARQIPRGRVTSYGAIAAYLGAKSSARMVGWAMNDAFHLKPAVPAHRVVNRNGMLSGKNAFRYTNEDGRIIEERKDLCERRCSG